MVYQNQHSRQTGARGAPLWDWRMCFTYGNRLSGWFRIQGEEKVMSSLLLMPDNIKEPWLTLQVVLQICREESGNICLRASFLHIGYCLNLAHSALCGMRYAQGIISL